MKVLLDENLPRKFKFHFVEYEAFPSYFEFVMALKAKREALFLHP
jgi:hypothetical protein